MTIFQFLLRAVLIFTVAPCFCLASLAKVDHQEKMLETLAVIKNTMEVQYAPAIWKKNHCGWDIDEEFNRAKRRLKNLQKPSVKAFQKIVRDFLASTQDYHVGVNFYSTESASLPFCVKGVNEKYFISYIDREKLSPDVFPFEIGDEVVRFDGKKTHEVLRELQVTELATTTNETDQALSEIFLTQRIGSMGHSVPKGPIKITVQSRARGNTKSYQLIWNYSPEKIQDAHVTKSMAFDRDNLRSEPNLDLLLTKEFTAPFAFQCLQEELNSSAMGAKKSFIPQLGPVKWKTADDSSFYAYIYEDSEGRDVGYIRISDYMKGADEAKEFSAIIKHMESSTDALVIDQVNNPGGSVFYLYALVSMLSDESLFAPRHRMAITQKEVMVAVTFIPVFESIRSDIDAKKVLGLTLDGNPVTYQMAQFFLNYFRFIVDEWQEGRTITEPFYLFGFDHINPHPDTRYTKPILVLVNHLDFSGGDFFPAILQDNKRATIMGTRTAGAGGYVTMTEFPNLYGIANYHYTGSLAERVDSNPIENLGVEPDIPYSLSEVDLQENYCEFVQKIQTTVDDLLK